MAETLLTLAQFRAMARARTGSVAHLYNLTPRYLALQCLLGNVPGAKKQGKFWWVTAAGMDATFGVK